MDVWQMVAEWPESDDSTRYAWAQQVRFDISLTGEDVPALVALYRAVLQHNSSVQRPMEEALLTALARIGDKAAVPLFEVLLFGETSGVSPIAEVVEALGEIAGRSADPEAFSLLVRCLDHHQVDARDMAATTVARAYKMAGLPAPRELVQHLYTMLQSDPARRVRFSAGLALEELGEISPVEVIFWAEEMAGWEEDSAWSIEDEEWGAIETPPFDDDTEWMDRLSS